MSSRQVKDILASAKTTDLETENILKQMHFQESQKQWHEFGETIINLVYSKREFECQSLLMAVINQLNNSLDVYVIIQLVWVYTQRANFSVEEGLKLLDKQKALTKANPLAELYIELLKVKLFMLNSEVERGYKLL